MQYNMPGASKDRARRGFASGELLKVSSSPAATTRTGTEAGRSNTGRSTPLDLLVSIELKSEPREERLNAVPVSRMDCEENVRAGGRVPASKM